MPEIGGEVVKAESLRSCKPGVFYTDLFCLRIKVVVHDLCVWLDLWSWLALSLSLSLLLPDIVPRRIHGGNRMDEATPGNIEYKKTTSGLRK